MKGKRFATPTGDPSMRAAGYAQPHSFSTPTAGRWRSPGGVAERPPPREEPARPTQLRSHPRPSAGPHAPSLTPTPERRHRQLVSRSPQSSVPGASVHHMLTELVDLSHSIAALLEQEGGLSPTPPALTSSARQQEAGLKTQEIERIVHRVEAHFVDKIQTLEATNATLKEEVRQLRDALAQAQVRSEHPKTAAAALRDVRGGLKDEIEALDALDKAWMGDGGGGGAAAAQSEAEQLRRVLLAEKRQRLRVEEQTQSLTEQHAKVVGTLERRLKKQEDQLYDLIAAIDRGYSGAPASPTRSTERGSSHRLPTPRHLLRQQLAQHQQTQRALQEYKENLRYESPSPTQSDDAAAMAELGLDDVRRTLESIRSSKPLTVQAQTQVKPKATPPPAVNAAAVVADDDDDGNATVPSAPRHEEPEIVYTSVSAFNAAAPTPPPPPSQQQPAQPPAAQKQALFSTREVDEITSFLDNITKELESLDAA